MPVYYVSNKAEVCYLPLERAILAVVHAIRKLPHYFQAYTVVVLTQLPFRSLFRKANYRGRVAKWAMILGAFDIKYTLHTSIKDQVLVDLETELAKPSFEENGERPCMDGKSVGVVSL